MSSIYNPNGALVVPVTFQGAQTQLAITSSTNAAPIVVLTSGAHGFQNGDFVEVEGHQVNSAANGVWQCTVVDSTHVSLNGSTGNGVGGATGIITDYSLNPVLQIPGDGDLASASNINTPIEGIANAAPYLYRLAGKFRIYGSYSNGVVDDQLASIWATRTLTASTFQTVGSPLLAGGLPSPAPVFGGGDHLQIQMQFSANCVAEYSVGIGVAYSGGSFSLIPGSTVSPPFIGTTNKFAAVSLCAVSLYSPFGAGTFFPFDISVMACGLGTTNALFLAGSWSINVTHFRPVSL